MPHPAERPNSADPIRGRTTLGDFELTILSDGIYFLDGKNARPPTPRIASFSASTPSSSVPATTPSPLKPV